MNLPTGEGGRNLRARVKGARFVSDGLILIERERLFSKLLVRVHLQVNTSAPGDFSSCQSVSSSLPYCLVSEVYPINLLQPELETSDKVI